jgi:thioredoxin-dependent peroxiredoxin
MTWVYFEDSDRQTAAPAFTLERTGGGRISLYDYYERSSLVVLFPSGRADDAVKPDSQEALQRFAARLEEIEREGAEVVAVLPDMALALDSPGCENALPFPLLADPGGRVREKYAGLMVAELVPPGSALLYVLDVYGVPWAAYVGERLDEDSLVDEVLSWLVFIGVQCPE